MADPLRRERIRAALIAQYREDGHQIVVHEGETYARLVEKAGRCTLNFMDINLDTLAAQIDRKIK